MLNFIFVGSLLISLNVFGDYLVTGSSTVAPVLKQLSENFETSHKGISFEVQTGGSSRGIADALRGVSDLGMVSRALNKNEKQLYSFLLARDGIGVIVHPSNPLNNVSTDILKQIYTGKIKSWDQFTNLKGDIQVISKAAGRSTLEVFKDYLNIKFSDIKANIIIGDNEQAIRSVAQDARAIAYVSIGAAEYHIKNNKNIKLLSLDGIAAKSETVKTGKYPMSRELNLVAKNKPEGEVLNFIEFLKTDKAQQIIEAMYFVPIYKK